MFELWLCVVGGDNEDERLLYKGDDLMDLEQAIEDADEEVLMDADKYFLLNGITFYSYRDYKANGAVKFMMQSLGFTYDYEY